MSIPEEDVEEVPWMRKEVTDAMKRYEISHAKPLQLIKKCPEYIGMIINPMGVGFVGAYLEVLMVRRQQECSILLQLIKAAGDFTHDSMSMRQAALLRSLIKQVSIERAKKTTEEGEGVALRSKNESPSSLHVTMDEIVDCRLFNESSNDWDVRCGC